MRSGSFLPVALAVARVVSAGEQEAADGAASSWLSPACFAVAGALVAVLVGIVILRWQVRAKTLELAAKNEDLEREIERGELARIQLRDSEQRLQAVLDSIPHGIVLFDAEGRVLSANPGAVRILGVSRDQVRTSCSSIRVSSKSMRAAPFSKNPALPVLVRARVIPLARRARRPGYLSRACTGDETRRSWRQ